MSEKKDILEQEFERISDEMSEEIPPLNETELKYKKHFQAVETRQNIQIAVSGIANQIATHVLVFLEQFDIVDQEKLLINAMNSISAVETDDTKALQVIFTLIEKGKKMPRLLFPDEFSLPIPCESGEVSDGYHTFDELYEHRHLLYISFISNIRGFPVWRSKIHDDGTSFDGFFLLGIDFPWGPVSYHVPEKYWDLLSEDESIKTLEKAPPFDGYTSNDVVKRLQHYLNYEEPEGEKVSEA